MTYKSKEIYNQENIKLLLEQNIFTLEEIINDGGSCKNGEEFYTTHINKCLTMMSRMPNGMRVKYSYADGCTQGRQFVKPCGIQNLPRNIRNLLVEGTGLIDYDIANAHYAILHKLCLTHNITCPILTTLVNNRTEFLNSVNKTKHDLLVFLNTDKPFTHSIKILEDFDKELSTIKNILINHYPNLIENIKKKSKNIISSKLNKIICYYENEAVMKVINHYKLKNASIIFDGLMTKVQLNLDDLHELTGYKWTIKEPTPFQLEDYIVDNEYDINKREMETNSFLCLHPVSFYNRTSPNHDYHLITRKDFCDKNAIYSTDGKCFVEKWLKDKNRRTKDEVVFNPDPMFDSQNDRIFNTFKPFKASTIKTDRQYNEKDIQFFKDIIRNNTGGSDECYNYLMGFLAQLIQQPHNNPHVCIVIKGLQGTGKDSITHILQLIFGLKNKYLVKIGNIDRITGAFTECLDEKLVVQINEMDGKNGSKYNNQLKDLITAEENAINKKHKSIYFQQSYIRYFIYSNNMTPVVIEGTDRRYVVFDAGFVNRRNKDFWNNVYTQLKDEHIIYSIYNYLMTYDISRFNPSVLVETQAKKNMKVFSGCPVFKFLHREFFKNNPTLYKTKISKVEYELIYCSALYTKYEESEYYEQYREKRDTFKKLCLQSGMVIKRNTIPLEMNRECNTGLNKGTETTVFIKQPIRDCYCIDRKKIVEYLQEVLIDDEEDEFEDGEFNYEPPEEAY